MRKYVPLFEDMEFPPEFTKDELSGDRAVVLVIATINKECYDKQMQGRIAVTEHMIGHCIVENTIMLAFDESGSLVESPPDNLKSMRKDLTLFSGEWNYQKVLRIIDNEFPSITDSEYARVMRDRIKLRKSIPNNAHISMHWLDKSNASID